jgi:hypothetical protein
MPVWYRRETVREQQAAALLVEPVEAPALRCLVRRRDHIDRLAESRQFLVVLPEVLPPLGALLPECPAALLVQDPAFAPRGAEHERVLRFCDVWDCVALLRQWCGDAI